MKKLQIRRGLAEDLPILEIGEMGFTLDTKKLYIGSEVGNILINTNYELATISGGDVGTKFTGHTLPFSYKNAHTDNKTFWLASSYNVTITGLGDYATITGNGTKEVIYTMTHNGDTDLAVEFTITVDGKNYVGTWVYYGKEPDEDNCLTLAQKYSYHSGDVFGDNWIIVESASLPTFSGVTTAWSGIYSFQVVGFNIARFSNTTTSNYFLSYCFAFNQPINLPAANSIGTYFLSYCYAFNQPINLPAANSISTNFLYYCYAFNQPINLPAANSIGNYFLYYCYAFNQPINLPAANSIGNYFLYYCFAFNQPINLPAANSIGTNFLYYCYAFNSTLTLNPSMTGTIGTNFMQNTYGLTDLEWNIPKYPSASNSLVSSTEKVAAGGVRIWGTHAAGLKAALPDSATRKLVLGSTYHD